MKKDLPQNPEDENDTYRTLTIASGVKLILPYLSGGTTASTNTINPDESITGIYENKNNPMGTDAVAQENSVDKNGNPLCSTKVVLGSGVQLYIVGDMVISGELDGGNATLNYCGQTSGYHARLALEAGSNVTVKGKLRVPGFIVDGKTGSGTVTVESGGILYQPMVVRDFKGGSMTAKIYAAIKLGTPLTPFNEIAFMNVDPAVTVKYGGNVINYANIHANSAVNSTLGQMVGSNSGAFVQLYEKSYLVFDYDHGTNVIDIHIYGGARTNIFVVNVEFGGDNYVCSSDQFIFPISWMYNITLDCLTTTDANGNVTRIPASYATPTQFKLLPGSKMTVMEGAKLTIKELTVYESFADPNTVKKYPTNYSERTTTLTGALPPAELIVNGTLSATKLGGKVWSSNPNNAKVSAKTVSYTVKEVSGDGGSTNSPTFTLTLHFGSNAAVTHAGGGRAYITENSAWVQSQFFDFTVGEGYTITVSGATSIIDPNGNVVNATSGTFGAGYVITLPSNSSVTYNFTDGTWYALNGDKEFSSPTAYNNQRNKAAHSITLSGLYSQVDPIRLPQITINDSSNRVSTKTLTVSDAGNGIANVKVYLENTRGLISGPKNFAVTKTYIDSNKEEQVENVTVSSDSLPIIGTTKYYATINVSVDSTITITAP